MIERRNIIISLLFNLIIDYTSNPHKAVPIRIRLSLYCVYIYICHVLFIMDGILCVYIIYIGFLDGGDWDEFAEIKILCKLPSTRFNMHNDDYLKHASEDSVKQIILQIEKA